MKRKSIAMTLVVVAVCGIAGASHAGTVWDEDNSGDLSNNGLSPTSVALTTGSNTILGSMGNSDRDYFTFTVPAGTTLTSIKVLNNTFVSGGSSFMGLQAGPQVTVPTSGLNYQQILLGWTHYNSDSIDTDLLPTIMNSINPLGSSLSSGAYSVWLNETGGLATYGFELTVTPTAAVANVADAPLPTWAYVLLAAALLGMTFNRKLHEH